jgi:hypothetical protein
LQTDFREPRALAAADVRHDVDELVELDAAVRVLIDFLDQLSNLHLKPLSMWQERIGLERTGSLRMNLATDCPPKLLAASAFLKLRMRCSFQHRALFTWLNGQS